MEGLDDEPAFAFADEAAKARLRVIRDAACQIPDVRGKQPGAVAAATEVVRSATVRYGYCDEQGIRPAFKLAMREREAPDSIVLAYTKFCLDTLHSVKEGQSLDLKALGRHYHWLRVEQFCLYSDAVSDPSGWVGGIKPNTESHLRWRRVVTESCDGLRAGRITLSDAWYRFNQETLRVQAHAKSDAVRASLDLGTAALKVLQYLGVGK